MFRTRRRSFPRLFDHKRPTARAAILRRRVNANGLQNQHAVAVAEETVAFANSFLVGTQDEFSRCKRAHEHEQCGFWEMEIRQQYVHDAKLEWRTDEQVGAVFAR